ncbi:MAG TPA: 4-hydroxy-tetrahydrodipicolinate synthase, partial [Chloroflexi bacterium]|nr:4-hydroxy-tetrahydrodipicolinate synthase [Chloroflexota bacterium]
MQHSGYRPGGVNPALVTPFTRNDEVDEEALRKLLRFARPNVDGVVPCGTTGEFVYMSLEERRRVLEICVNELGGELPVIAGTGAPSTREAIELARHAQEVGATACLVVTPYYLHPSDKGVYQHFYEVAKAVELPIILYNIPQTVDAQIPREVLEDLSEIDNIVGLKDSSGNLPYTMEVLEMTQGRLDVLVGHDEVVLPALAGGCSGMILASAQVFPEVWQEIVRKVRSGDVEGARQEQKRVQKLARIFVRYGGGVAVKAALNMMGVSVGPPRRPLKPVGGALIHETRAEIQLELEKLGKIQPQDTAWAMPEGPLEDKFKDLGISASELEDKAIRLGTAIEGSNSEMAGLDVIMGPKAGPVGAAFARQLTHPRHGYEALTTIAEPNLTVKPSTLIVPTIELVNLRQASMVYGPTQAAVAKAILDSIEEGTIPRPDLEDEVMIVKATIHPRALDRHQLYANVRQAMYKAIRMAYGQVGPQKEYRKT